MWTAHRHHLRRYQWSPTSTMFGIFLDVRDGCRYKDPKRLWAEVSGGRVWQSKRSSIIDSSCSQNPYIPLVMTWIQARPPMVFIEFTNGGSIGVRRQVDLTRWWKAPSPLDSSFRAKLAVTFKGRLLHSTVHSDEHVADCNHSTVQRGGEYDDDPFQTGHNNGH